MGSLPLYGQFAGTAGICRKKWVIVKQGDVKSGLHCIIPTFQPSQIKKRPTLSENVDWGQNLMGGWKTLAELDYYSCGLKWLAAHAITSQKISNVADHVRPHQKQNFPAPRRIWPLGQLDPTTLTGCKSEAPGQSWPNCAKDVTGLPKESASCLAAARHRSIAGKPIVASGRKASACLQRLIMGAQSATHPAPN